jgi:hypothetical protein
MDVVARDVAAAKTRSREDAARMLEGIKRAHADWLEGHNLKGRALRRAGTPFREAYDDLESWLNENRPPKSSRSKRGFIYFIGMEDDSSAVKIGFAGNVNARLSTLQTSSHQRLKVLIVIKGTLAKERELHRRFTSDHIRGEWFRRTEVIEEFIAANTEQQSELSSCSSSVSGALAAS